MNVILFGFKSCGKTYFGKRLSAYLSYPFIDTDRLIEKEYAILKKESSGCREIYIKLGKEGFQALETRALGALKNVRASVIAVGGGMVLDRSNVEILEKMGQLIYLSLNKDTLKKRILSSRLPAYLDPSDPERSFNKMYKKRKILYERIGAIQINASNKTDEVILEELLTAIKNRSISY